MWQRSTLGAGIVEKQSPPRRGVAATGQQPGPALEIIRSAGPPPVSGSRGTSWPATASDVASRSARSLSEAAGRLTFVNVSIIFANTDRVPASLATVRLQTTSGIPTLSRRSTAGIRNRVIHAECFHRQPVSVKIAPNRPPHPPATTVAAWNPRQHADQQFRREPRATRAPVSATTSATRCGSLRMPAGPSNNLPVEGRCQKDRPVAVPGTAPTTVAECPVSNGNDVLRPAEVLSICFGDLPPSSMSRAASVVAEQVGGHPGIVQDPQRPRAEGPCDPDSATHCTISRLTTTVDRSALIGQQAFGGRFRIVESLRRIARALNIASVRIA